MLTNERISFLRDRAETRNGWLSANCFETTLELLEEITSLRERVAELEAGQRWVPVGERLPSKSGCYWCYFVSRDVRPNRSFEATFHADYGQFSDKWGGVQVTHWRPLPAPPEAQ